MRLTKQTSHAIRVLIHCARTGGAQVKVAAIAAELGITQQNAFKIVHILVKSGFLTAARGRTGGVKLARPAAEIVIGAVVRATETTHVEVEAGTGGRGDGETGEGSAGPNLINSVLDDALEAFIRVLDQHTLADMAGLEGATPAAAPSPSSTEPDRTTRPKAPARRRPGTLARGARTAAS